MYIQATDPKVLDVSHKLKSVTSLFFEANNSMRLSMQRMTSPHSFDAVGCPITGGLK